MTQPYLATISDQPYGDLVTATGLQFAYSGEPVLKNIHLSVAPGEVVALVGPSGSGKTTLLYCLAGIIRDWSGSVRVAGQELAGLDDDALSDFRARSCGFVLQFGRLVPELHAVENVALPLMIQGVDRRRAIAAAREAMAAVGVAHLARARPARLSGGEGQRVAVARALVHSPQVIFADEPTGALDSANGTIVMESLTEQARQRGAAVVIVTHDPAAAAYADRVVQMRDGVLV